MNLSEIEPATFRIVAQRLNQLRYRVPQTRNQVIINYVRYVWRKLGLQADLCIRLVV
jgi:hypothetical protein